MKRNAIETVIGFCVLFAAMMFIYFVYTAAEIRPAPGNQIDAVFTKVGGLAVGSDVRINGIKVGSVTDRHLEPTTYEAVVRMTVDRSIRLPADTVAVVASEGPLGGKYIQLEPGTATEFIPEDGVIRNTRSYRSLEDQVGEIIFLATTKPSPEGR
jgi:phospholipid/cholesterol/gamma-HCH transport system substrate-binding protein